jgi:hypothetical protein
MLFVFVTLVPTPSTDGHVTGQTNPINFATMPGAFQTKPVPSGRRSSSTRRHRHNRIVAPTVSGPIVAPTVDFQAFPSRDKVERNEAVTISLTITNKSGLPIIVSRINVPKEAFDEDDASRLPLLVSPYASYQTNVSITARDVTKFGLHRLMLSVDFYWSAEGKEFISTQPTAVTVEVTRRFEEEAKGFPGGTAAFLYLLLPIIPAFLSYQTMERIRMGKALEIPSFTSEHIVPAFFAAIVVSFLMLLTSHTETGIDYSNPKIFVSVLFLSLVMGALKPGIHGLWNLKQKVRWGFRPGDTMEEYLEKATLGPRVPDQYKWVRGTLSGESWEGILLQQPNEAWVLGAQLQVSSMVDPDDPTYSQTISDIGLNVVSETGEVKNAKRLVEMVNANQLTLDYLKKITQGGEPRDVRVVVGEINNKFRIEDQRLEFLVRLFR